MLYKQHYINYLDYHFLLCKLDWSLQRQCAKCYPTVKGFTTVAGAFSSDHCTGSDAFYMCGEFGINRRRAGHDHRHHSRTDNNNNIKGWKKIQEKRRHIAHTLWLAVDPWELQHRHTTQRRWPKMESDLKKTKRSSRLSWSVNHSKTPPMTENNETLKSPVLFPSLQCLQQRQCVSDAHDVKRTTVRALWWRTVYWSGSLCLCKRFDISSFAVRGKAAVFGFFRCSPCVCLFRRTHKERSQGDTRTRSV